MVPTQDIWEEVQRERIKRGRNYDLNICFTSEVENVKRVNIGIRFVIDEGGLDGHLDHLVIPSQGV